MESMAIILIIIGIILLIAEIFIPSFGVTGVIGIISIIAGVIFTSDTFFGGLLLFTVIIVFSIILMYIAYKLFSSVKSPLILTESVNEEQVNKELSFFLGKNGEAVTPLRPSGTVDFDGVRLDVITRGEFIEKGSDIRVEKIEGKKIIVKMI